MNQKVETLIVEDANYVQNKLPVTVGHGGHAINFDLSEVSPLIKTVDDFRAIVRLLRGLQGRKLVLLDLVYSNLRQEQSLEGERSEAQDWLRSLGLGPFGQQDLGYYLLMTLDQNKDWTGTVAIASTHVTRNTQDANETLEKLQKVFDGDKRYVTIIGTAAGGRADAAIDQAIVDYLHRFAPELGVERDVKFFLSPPGFVIPDFHSWFAAGMHESAEHLSAILSEYKIREDDFDEQLEYAKALFYSGLTVADKRAGARKPVLVSWLQRIINSLDNETGLDRLYLPCQPGIAFLIAVKIALKSVRREKLRLKCIGQSEVRKKGISLEGCVELSASEYFLISTSWSSVVGAGHQIEALREAVRWSETGDQTQAFLDAVDCAPRIAQAQDRIDGGPLVELLELRIRSSSQVLDTNRLPPYSYVWPFFDLEALEVGFAWPVWKPEDYKRHKESIAEAEA